MIEEQRAEAGAELGAEFLEFVNMPNRDGNTALRAAMEALCEAGVEALLAAGATDITGEVGQWINASMLRKAARAGDASLVANLLSDGTDANVKDEHGNTAVYLAAMRGHVDCLALLLLGGGEMEVREE